jgi:putative Mg2+ transporter-C (MgtC) family protein
VDLPSNAELIGRLLLAAVLGGLIGLERELRDHPAGLRTHITVAVGSALFVIAGAYGWSDFLTGRDATNVSISVDRVASTVVTGIGFLGGGAILKHGASVKGLTTAGSLWVTSAVGLAAALGSYTIVLAATAITLLSLVGLRIPERWIQRRLALDHEAVVIRLAAGGDASAVIGALAALDGLRIRELAVRRDDEGTLVEASLVSSRGASVAEVVAPLAQRDDVTAVEVV